MGEPRESIVRHWISEYNYWDAKLKGEKPEMYPDNPCKGFYKNGIREQKPSGLWRRVGWNPVAIFENNGTLVGRIGTGDDTKDLTGDDLLGLWEYCGGNAITEEAYRAVAERGEPWPIETKEEMS